MTDETVHIQPAIPSRAAQQPATPFTPPEQVLTTENPRKSRAGVGAKGAVTRARNIKRAARLNAAEIMKINAKRRKALRNQGPVAVLRPKKAAAPVLKKRKAKRRAMRIMKRVAEPVVRQQPKNLNRPLEMKNQLSAVLSMVGTLQKAELVFFSQAVPAMQALSRSGRRSVIAALQQVYG